jgi:threonine dehydrogenase-like Zn-dependent dehydrogenase
MENDLMNAAVITAPGTVSVGQIERWLPGKDEILVRCKAAAICTTERRLFSGDLKFYPALGGHEFSGVVEQVNDARSGLEPGDHVAIDPNHRCGRCHYCVRGHNNLCANRFAAATRSNYIIVGGGFAEYAVLVPGQAVKIPEETNLDEASLLEPLSCCIHSMKKTHLPLGGTIAIVGAGTMGAMHLLLAKLSGARVIVSDPDEARLSLLMKMGADILINPQLDDPVQVIKDHTQGRGADAVVVAASARPAGEQALKMVGPTGVIVFYASLYPPGNLDLDWNRVHYEEITIRGTEGSTNKDFHEAVALLVSGAVDLSPLISRAISLEELPDELGSKPAGETQRVIVRP